MSGVPGPVGRFTMLFLSPFYLILLASILSRSTGNPMALTIFGVFLGAFVVMILFAILCSRFQSNEHAQSQFSISTLMMVTAILGIYFSYINQVTSGLNFKAITTYGILVLSLYSIFFITITSLILLRFADAIVALFEAILDLVKRYGNTFQ